MITHEEWLQDQMKPLSMFETAKWWAEGIKVAGAGNGAGLLTAGAALSAFHDHHASLLLVKIAGTSFFIGVLAFAIAFFKLYQAMHAQDEVAHATLKKDVAGIKRNSPLSASSMILANNAVLVSAATFFLGCIVGLTAFLSF